MKKFVNALAAAALVVTGCTAIEATEGDSEPALSGGAASGRQTASGSLSAYDTLIDDDSEPGCYHRDDRGRCVHFTSPYEIFLDTEEVLARFGKGDYFFTLMAAPYKLHLDEGELPEVFDGGRGNLSDGIRTDLAASDTDNTGDVIGCSVELRDPASNRKLRVSGNSAHYLGDHQVINRGGADLIRVMMRGKCPLGNPLGHRQQNAQLFVCPWEAHEAGGAAAAAGCESINVSFSVERPTGIDLGGQCGQRLDEMCDITFGRLERRPSSALFEAGRAAVHYPFYPDTLQEENLLVVTLSYEYAGTEPPDNGIDSVKFGRPAQTLKPVPGARAVTELPNGNYGVTEIFVGVNPPAGAHAISVSDSDTKISAVYYNATTIKATEDPQKLVDLDGDSTNRGQALGAARSQAVGAQACSKAGDCYVARVRLGAKELRSERTMIVGSIIAGNDGRSERLSNWGGYRSGRHIVDSGFLSVGQFCSGAHPSARWLTPHNLGFGVAAVRVQLSE